MTGLLLSRMKAFNIYSSFSDTTILLVEDDLHVRTVLRVIFKKFGLQVLEASNAEEAILLWTNFKNKISVLYSDYYLPGELNGLDLAKYLLNEKPELSIIISSGHEKCIEDEDHFTHSKLYFIHKPFEINYLKSILEACINEKKSNQNNITNVLD